VDVTFRIRQDGIQMW